MAKKTRVAKTRVARSAKKTKASKTPQARPGKAASKKKVSSKNAQPRVSDGAGHVFGRPRPSAKKHVTLHTTPERDTHCRDLPEPTGGDPFQLDLASVIAPADYDAIVKKGKLTFHLNGDMGGIQYNVPQTLVAHGRVLLAFIEHGQVAGAERHSLGGRGYRACRGPRRASPLLGHVRSARWRSTQYARGPATSLLSRNGKAATLFRYLKRILRKQVTQDRP